jgi:2-hydroxychromene-2-carboxylate isomerase
MALSIDYYLAPQSPWVYLGHLRFWDLARKAGARIHVRPVDLGAVFPATGGLPLPKRAPQRQAYRLLELRRYAEFLHAPINIQPKYFPVSGDAAAKLIIAVDQKDGADAAMHIADAIQRAVWVEERNIGSEATLAELLAERELPAARLEESHSQAVHEQYELDSQSAIEAGVFGVPSYVVDGEIFWGQDRLDFLQRRLAQP